MAKCGKNRRLEELRRAINKNFLHPCVFRRPKNERFGVCANATFLCPIRHLQRTLDRHRSLSDSPPLLDKCAAQSDPHTQSRPHREQSLYLQVRTKTTAGRSTHWRSAALPQRGCDPDSSEPSGNDGWTSVTLALGRSQKTFLLLEMFTRKDGTKPTVD